MKVRPKDNDARMKYSECNKIVKRLAFERAIAVDDNSQSVADQINLDKMSRSYVISLRGDEPEFIFGVGVTSDKVRERGR